MFYIKEIVSANNTVPLLSWAGREIYSLSCSSEESPHGFPEGFSNRQSYLPEWLPEWPPEWLAEKLPKLLPRGLK